MFIGVLCAASFRVASAGETWSEPIDVHCPSCAGGSFRTAFPQRGGGYMDIVPVGATAHAAGWDPVRLPPPVAVSGTPSARRLVLATHARA